MAGREGDYVKNSPNKTDLTNESKNGLISPRNFQLKYQKNAIISIVGTVIFAILTILFPLLKVLGGFLTYSYSFPTGNPPQLMGVYYWDQIAFSTNRGPLRDSNYLDFAKAQSSTELIWQIIHLWGPIYIILGLIGAGLVVLPAFQKLKGHKTADVGKIGLIIGLVATVVEFGLFILAWGILTSTGELNNGVNYTINFFLLDCFVIGWIGLTVGSVFAPKN